MKNNYVSYLITISILLIQLCLSNVYSTQLNEQSIENPTQNESNSATTQDSSSAIFSDDNPLPGLGPEEPMFSESSESQNMVNLPQVSSLNAILSSFQTDLYSGKATLNIPINLPSGNKGLQPNLNLIYQSGVSNTWCGMGWMLDTGSICKSTKKGVPEYDNTDIFEFNFNGSSSELILVGSDEYRSKIESNFMKFKYQSHYWIVTDESGTKYYFGQTEDSRQQKDVNHIYSWHLDKVIDVHSNYMLFTYYLDQNQIYPYQILYTGNEIINQSPKYIVNFILTDREDKRSNYKPGIKISTSKRLSSINVQYNGIKVLSYNLEYYDLSSLIRSSLLKSITLRGTEDQLALPVVSFEYEQVNNVFNSLVEWLGVNGPEINEAWMGIRANGTSPPRMYVDIFDINGDGLPDRVRSPGNSIDTDFTKWHIQLNNGSGFNPPIEWPGVAGPEINEAWMGIRVNGTSPPRTYVDIFDINGDGLPDRIRSASNGIDTDFTKWHVQLNNGSGFNPPVEWPGVAGPEVNEAWMGIRAYGTSPLRTYVDTFDINGDGLPDRIRSASNGIDTDFTKWHVQLNNGSGFNPPVEWPGVAGPDQNSEYWMCIRSFNEDVKVDIFDMNGDGLPDRIRSASNGVDTDFTKWYVQLNNGSGFDSPIEWTGVAGPEINEAWMGIRANGTSPPRTYVDIMDINGDGLPDRVRSPGNSIDTDFTKWHVQLNNGLVFGSPIEWSGVDGPETNEAWMGIRATGTSPPRTYVDIFDINGDGLPDRVRSPSNGVDTDFTKWHIQLNNNLATNLLCRVSNGIGAQTNITYKPYKGADNTEPTQKNKLPFPVWVVDTVSSSDSVSGDSNTITYNYDSGVFDFDEREFRGFGYVKVIDNDGSYNETWFHQDDVYKGKIYKQQVSDNDGTVYTKTETTWQTESLYDDKVKFPYQSQVDSYSYQ